MHDVSERMNEIEWTDVWKSWLNEPVNEWPSSSSELKKKNTFKTASEKTWLKCYLRGANRIHHSTGGTKFKFQKIHNDNSQKNHLGVKSTWLIEMSK